MQRSNNFNQWVNHYTDILEPEYDKFYIFFKSRKEEPPSYQSFLNFIFLNTKKFNYNGKLIAPIY